jgi:AcrR family transcriptional regulator
MPRGEFDRAPRRAETRARLLEAAARVYARRGFDGATLDEVAAEAGLTKGAVYDHFGSKEKLLLALLDEHLSAQIAEQLTLFDVTQDTAERPRAGADRWMKHLDEDPDAFRLFVEAWVHAQRDDELRARVVAGMDAWRATFRGFAGRRASAGELAVSDELLDQLANVMVAIGTGFAMSRLADPDGVSPRLLGAVYVLLIRAIETSAEARELLTGATPASSGRSRSRAASA